MLCKVTKNCSRFWIPASAGMTAITQDASLGHSLSSPRKRGGSGNPEVWFRRRWLGEYRTIDLARFGYERMRIGEAVRETNCY